MVDLFDARGYETVLTSSTDAPVDIIYMGAEKSEHPGLTYAEDPYVVSRVSDQTFQKQYSCALKDKGIRLSGLRIILEAECGTVVTVTVSNEQTAVMTAGPDGKIDELLDVSGLAAREKEYLASVHSILYKLLAEVDRVCRKLDIKYFLVYGGLLGVVRFGEILPWDDDIDVAMTREDFTRFRQEAPKELGPDFEYLDCSDLGGGAFLDFLCRILYVKEPLQNSVFRKVSQKCRAGIEDHVPLDIYILDKASDNANLHSLQMLMMKGIYGLSMGHRAYVDPEEYAGRDPATRISVRILSALGRFIPMSLLFRMHEKISMMNDKKDTKDYFFSNGFLLFIHTRYDQKWFDGCSVVKLGDLLLCAPADVEAWLKRAYYDYYHYRPVQSRVPEHSPWASGVFG